MCLHSAALPYLLQGEIKREFNKQVLFLFKSVRVGSVLLRLFYSGGFQGRLLYDHFAGISDSRGLDRDEKRLAAPPGVSGGGRRLWDLFCVFAERDVCGGYQAFALSELDF